MQFFLPQGCTSSLPSEYAHDRFSPVYFGSLHCVSSPSFHLLALYLCLSCSRLSLHVQQLLVVCSYGRRVDAQLSVYIGRACQSAGSSRSVRGPPNSSLWDFSLGQVSFPRGESFHLLGEPGHGWDFPRADSVAWRLTPTLNVPVSCQGGGSTVTWLFGMGREWGTLHQSSWFQTSFTPHPQGCLVPEPSDQPDSCRVLTLWAGD